MKIFTVPDIQISGIITNGGSTFLAPQQCDGVIIALLNCSCCWPACRAKNRLLLSLLLALYVVVVLNVRGGEILVSVIFSLFFFKWIGSVTKYM